MPRKITHPRIASLALDRHYASIWRNVKPDERQRRIKAMLEAVSNGSTTAAEARKYGLSKGAVSMVMATHAPELWHKAILTREILDLQKNLRELEYSKTLIDDARLRKKIKLRVYVIERLMHSTGTHPDASITGDQMINTCPACGSQNSFYASLKDVSKEAKCCICGYHLPSLDYLRLSPAELAERARSELSDSDPSLTEAIESQCSMDAELDLRDPDLVQHAD